jgi:hypothetical protein
MSIYSGFATRKQEDLYNSLLETLAKEISNKLLKAFLLHADLEEDSLFKKTLFTIIKKL